MISKLLLYTSVGWHLNFASCIILGPTAYSFFDFSITYRGKLRFQVHKSAPFCSIAVTKFFYGSNLDM